MSQVHFELRDRVAVLRLDDGKANALSYAVMDALDAALDRAEKEARADRALTGRPGRFCAGFDLQGDDGRPGPRSRAGHARRGPQLRCYMEPLPFVTAGSGHALAGGALLLLTGDYPPLGQRRVPHRTERGADRSAGAGAGDGAGARSPAPGPPDRLHPVHDDRRSG